MELFPGLPLHKLRKPKPVASEVAFVQMMQIIERHCDELAEVFLLHQRQGELPNDLGIDGLDAAHDFAHHIAQGFPVTQA